MDIVTQKGQPASILGLAGNQSMEESCVRVAFEAGVNYFFFYNMTFNNLLDGLKPLLTANREELLVVTGSENRELRELNQYLDKVRRPSGSPVAYGGRPSFSTGLTISTVHRYNMAHRKAEEKVLPAALQAEIPVIAFTCKRWGSLLKGHPDWQQEVPSAADCYRYALRHPAVRLALTAPQTLTQLQENLRVLQAPQRASE